MFRFALLVPLERGEKVTVIVQLPPGATLERFALVLKRIELDPERERELMVKVSVPVLETLIVPVDELFTLMLPKLRLSGLTEMTGFPFDAPDWVAVKVWPAAVMVPVRAPLPVLGPIE